MPSLGTIASALTSKVPSKSSKAYLIELDKSTDAPKLGDGPGAYVAFQYFPESITDSKQINYQQKEIPGGSLPLYQWISSGERLISFTAVFTSDVDYGSVSVRNSGQLLDPTNPTQGASTLQQRLRNSGQLKRNPDLRGAVAWLRRYLVPTYSNNYTFAPNKLRLFMPNSGIGIAGGSDSFNRSPDSMNCVMTQCEVTYESFFESGIPRHITVSLSFAQLPQLDGGVYFPSANDGSAIQQVASQYTNLFPRE